MNITATVVFILLFGFVTLLGFFAARWRRIVRCGFLFLVARGHSTFAAQHLSSGHRTFGRRVFEFRQPAFTVRTGIGGADVVVGHSAQQVWRAFVREPQFLRSVSRCDRQP